MGDHDHSAKPALLEAARRLFAREGFEKVSLRMLTSEAGVNLAAVNYHFGSKQGLVDAVIADFVNPVNAARLGALDAAEAEATRRGGTVSLEVILDCFTRPVLESVRRNDLAERLFLQLMGRCLNQQLWQTLPGSVRPGFEAVFTRFPEAIGRALPDLGEEEVLWRLHFTVGVLVHVLLHTESLLQLTGEKVREPSLEAILSLVIAYCRGGFASSAATDVSGDSNG